MKNPQLVTPQAQAAAAQPYAHPLLAALVADPADPPDLVVYRGYVGPADVAGLTRVYLNPLMSVWCDIPDGDVVLTAHVPPNANAPFGEDVVWVTRRAARRIPEEVTMENVRLDVLQAQQLRDNVRRVMAGNRPAAPAEAAPAAGGVCPCCGAGRVVPERLLGDGPTYGDSPIIGANVPWPPPR